MIVLEREKVSIDGEYENIEQCLCKGYRYRCLYVYVDVSKDDEVLQAGIVR